MVSKDTLIDSPGSVSSIERRGAPRFMYITNLKFLSTGGAIPGIVRNVSAEGLFVEIEAPYAIGKRLDLNFVLRSSKYPMNLTGEVVRKTPEGLGLRLI